MLRLYSQLQLFGNAKELTAAKVCHAPFSACYGGAFKDLCTSRQYAHSAILRVCAGLTNGAHMEVHTRCVAGVMQLSLYIYIYIVTV